ELISMVKEGVDALLVVDMEKIDGDVIEAAGSNLKIIARHGVGYDNVDVKEATRRGIYVTITRDILSETVADLTFGLILCLARRIHEGHLFVKTGLWRELNPNQFMGVDVNGKVLGIIGLGAIGTCVARRAKAFNMKVVYYDIIRRRETEEKLDIEFKDLDTLLSISDYVSIHVPLTEETRGLIGKKEIDLMKRTAFLINTARGAVIDREALIDALVNRKITGAALDVYWIEPIPQDDPILKLENILLTPHIGSATIECRRKMAIAAAEEIARCLRGEKPINIVNPEVLEVVR
ncbi:MAG: D-glycerate dehydrogenase, partial [Candidatus Methanomethylicia archaeon]